MLYPGQRRLYPGQRGLVIVAQVVARVWCGKRGVVWCVVCGVWAGTYLPTYRNDQLDSIIDSPGSIIERSGREQMRHAIMLR